MPIPHREGLAVDRELKPLCVDGGEGRGRLSSRVLIPPRPVTSTRGQLGCPAVETWPIPLYAAREAAYAGIASPPDMEAEDPHYVLVGQRAANGALCV